MGNWPLSKYSVQATLTMSEVLETIFVHFLFVFLNSFSLFQSIIIYEIERVSTLFVFFLVEIVHCLLEQPTIVYVSMIWKFCASFLMPALCRDIAIWKRSISLFQGVKLREMTTIPLLYGRSNVDSGCEPLVNSHYSFHSLYSVNDFSSFQLIVRYFIIWH